MKRNMIFRSALLAVAAVTAGILTTACSDWDDHYDAGSAIEGTATSTLWENISSNANLSQFAALMKKAGYDQVLGSSQTFTVWAPLNGTFDYETLVSEGNSKLLKEFVQNHIARSNYPASGILAENVSMLNKKRLRFEGSGSYTMDGVAVAQPNVASSNGVIHTLSGKLQFRQNIIESLESSQFAIDSISDYIHSYDVLRLNEGKSVQGPVVDGQITYLDSVFDDYNQLCARFAWIDREDSSYTMMVPTNEAWVKAMTTIRRCYNYIDKFDYLLNPSARGTNQTTETVELSNGAAYWRDSLAYLNMLGGLFFNNNLYDNVKLKNLAEGELPKPDSLVNTNYDILYGDDATDLFRGATRVAKSNGSIWVTGDTLNLHPWAVWNPLINVEAEYSFNQASVDNGSLSTVSIISGAQNPDVPGIVSNRRFAVISPATPTSNVEFNLYLPNVRSTTYVVYGVFVPANIVNVYETDLKPNNVQVRVGYNRADGTLLTSPVTLGTFQSDPTKVDTVCFGEVTFPICYYGMEGSPYLRILSRVGSSTASTYDRTLRIDRVFLVPKELDDYLKEHPDYKYDTGNRDSYTIYF